MSVHPRGMKGKRHTEETKMRMRDSHLKRRNALREVSHEEG